MLFQEEEGEKEREWFSTPTHKHKLSVRGQKEGVFKTSKDDRNDDEARTQGPDSLALHGKEKKGEEGKKGFSTPTPHIQKFLTRAKGACFEPLLTTNDDGRRDPPAEQPGAVCFKRRKGRKAREGFPRPTHVQKFLECKRRVCFEPQEEDLRRTHAPGRSPTLLC